MRLGLQVGIERGDALRTPSANGAGPEAYSEWHHFTFADPREGVHGIFNVALSGDVSDPERGRAGVSLVVCDGREWHGTMNLHPVETIRARPGRVGLEVGGNRVRFRAGRYEVAGALKDGSVEIAASWTPAASPLLVSDIDGLINTFIVPRLTVSGDLTLHGRRVPLEAVPGYHDHNWGHWRWGRDLGWDWGYVLEAGPGGTPRAAPGSDRPASGPVSRPIYRPISIVLGQVTDASRHSARSDMVLMVWLGDGLAHVFLDDAVSVRLSGDFPGRRVPRVPGLMTLFEPAGARGIPARVDVEARDGPERLALRLDVRNALQFLIPQPSGTGMTTVTELLGPFTVEGRLAGRPVAFSQPGFMELAG